MTAPVWKRAWEGGRGRGLSVDGAWVGNVDGGNKARERRRFVHRVLQVVDGCLVRAMVGRTFGSLSLFLSRGWHVDPPYSPVLRRNGGQMGGQQPRGRGVYPERTSTSNRKSWTPGRLFTFGITAMDAQEVEDAEKQLAERKKKRGAAGGEVSHGGKGSRTTRSKLRGEPLVWWMRPWYKAERLGI